MHDLLLNINFNYWHKRHFAQMNNQQIKVRMFSNEVTLVSNKEMKEQSEMTLANLRPISNNSN